MFSFVLNLPYTLVGIVIALFSGVKKIQFRKKPYAIIFHTGKLWWARGYMTNARAAAIGQCVILSPTTEVNDLEHELVHVEQYQRAPIIQPLLYYIELLRKGYRSNKYEEEAYRIAGNVYKGKIE